MRLLILGALGPYPERAQSFIEHQHQLWYVSTQSLPPAAQLSGIQACTYRDLVADTTDAAGTLLQLIESEQIDVIYSLLNVWDGSNSVTAALLRRGCPVPVVRHYKEHYLVPNGDEQTCLEQSTGVILINEESRDYFSSVYQLPPQTICLDADLIPRRYLAGSFQAKLSAGDHRPHLLIAGSTAADGGRYDYRDFIREVTALGAHVHLYGFFSKLTADGVMAEMPNVRGLYRDLVTRGRLHLHNLIRPAQFVRKWSCYDAGLLHVPRHNDAFRLLNLPNRYSAYLAAGVPVALMADEMPAMQRHLESLGAAIIYANAGDLVRCLPDPRAAAAAQAAREAVTFEAVYPALEEFLVECASQKV